MSNKKIYVVLLGVSGDGYMDDEPHLTGVYEKREDAVKAMTAAYEEYTCPRGTKETFKEEDYIEETNFDEDYHLIVRIYETNLE